MTLTRDEPELERPIESSDDLIAYFRLAETDPADFRVGTEHEKIGLYSDTLEPVPYEGARGIAALLEVLHKEYGFEAVYEGADVVALLRDGASITLEPGGQLELSGAPLLSLHETCREFREHLGLMKEVSQRFGIVWLGLGIHPLAAVSEIPRMPRERHEIMRSHLAACGDLALHMMHATGGVQANFDFDSEETAGRMLRLALAISPIVTALYANSSISSGEPNGFESFRAEIWRRTDPARCGFLPFAFAPDFLERGAYAAYTEWALDVPMFFLVRDGAYRRVGGRTFREMLDAGEPMTLSDWNIHLTTLFPEVRLKRVIEVRGADAVPPDLVCALPALWKGLLYDLAARDQAAELVRAFSHDDVDRMHADVARRGLRAEAPDGQSVAQIARALVQLAAEGLGRINARGAAGQNEVPFLDPLYDLLDRGRSPGRRILDDWEGPLDHRVDRLVEFAKY